MFIWAVFLYAIRFIMHQIIDLFWILGFKQLGSNFHLNAELLTILTAIHIISTKFLIFNQDIPNCANT